MKDFFKEYWPWILIPSLVVAGGIVALLFVSGNDSSGPFVYQLF